jgi:hypothetical protein
VGEALADLGDASGYDDALAVAGVLVMFGGI